ncbi:MAG: hypothetical protein JWO36_322 [Myxococcales bacterium]|nr:hypothetical protein [Myxococcales bacterium]
MKIHKTVFAIAIVVGAGRAGAWEAETTHTGLAEQAALASGLHKRLVTLGFSGGLFEPLTIPPADAPALIEDLHLLSPSHGAVPDARGRQTALSWIAAGSGLADVPASHGANHFYDPSTGHGWERPDRGFGDSISDRLREVAGRSRLPAQGVPAPDWISDKSNPFNVAGFVDQYAKAASAATPGERSRHMAAALVAAGAILHVLGDLGAPSRVRGDEAAHLDELGGGPDDLGSRFERIAALAYGRLGVPAPSHVVTRTRLRDYFTAKDGNGLADVIARNYFSPGTLPAPERMNGEVKPHLARPLPALPARLNLMAASRDDGTTLRSADGACLARYRVEKGILRFSLDDDCMLEQVTQILPEVASYETGLLDFLFRGELTITLGQTIAVTGKGLGAGTVEVLVEDNRGVRKSIGTAHSGGDELIHVPAPQSGTRVIAVFRGVDAAGEQIVAVGALPLTH